MIQTRQPVQQQRVLNLDIKCIEGEQMKLDKKYDLIVIIGSLEHCRDQKILSLCHKALADDGVIIMKVDISQFRNQQHI